MTELNSLASQISALEAVKRDGFDPTQRRIIEQLAITNELLLDMPVYPANDKTGTNHLVRTALPKGKHRAYNQGVKPSASQTKIVRDITVQLTGYSRIDEKIVREQRDPRGFRQGEDNAFLTSLAQDQVEDLIYGNNAADPTMLNGMATRRAKLSEQCIDLGGTGNALTSVYICKMGYDNVSLMYPAGADGIGVYMEDKGKKTVKDENGGEYEAYVSYFEVNYGLSVGNEKSLVRLANVQATGTNAISGQALAEKIITATKKLPAGDGKVVVYANSDVLNLIDLYLINKGNVQYTAKDQFGNEVIKIRDIMLRKVDSILNTESQVTA